MANLARQEMYFGRFFTVDDIIAEVETVGSADIQALAQQLFRPEAIALTILGNLGDLTVDREALAC
jgi:predicted Zn-dependent peptidase